MININVWKLMIVKKLLDCQSTLQYVDSSIFGFLVSYNALERREASKGGKDASKKSTTSHSSAKGSTGATSRAQVSQNARRNEASVNSGNQAANASKPSSNGGLTAYDEQVFSETE